MSKPVIGITTSHDIRSNVPVAQIAAPESYILAVQNAGGLPLLIPLCLPDVDLDELLSRLDGVLFPGGPDVDPALFHAPPHAEVYGIDADRDRVELGLVRRAVELDKPFFGICRGIQVINVALGGSLYTHIADQLPGAQRHNWYPGFPREHLAHPVRVQSGSRLSDILAHSSVQTNSLHHQGIDQPAPGINPVAWAPDGLIEAVELPGHRFALGVQWHPENLQAYPEMRALFQAFVEAAG